ncbi:MAG: hypothetical protein IT494_00430 [Gammaproteobacteria bacterium]|nr:hypothetical protein [Gammaproteobacteria bacterium]
MTQERAALDALLDRYLDALASQDPGKVPWTPAARCSENNVQLAIGDGLWGTCIGLGGYRLRFADPVAGAVGFFGQVREPLAESLFALRLKVTGGRVAEAECIVLRLDDEGFKLPQAAPIDKPVLQEIVPPERRRPRARMLSIADGYLDTLQLNDGALFTHFHPDCDRIENGFQTTNNPDATVLPNARLGCEEQFRLGIYRYDDRLRDRRYPLIDEERGLVLAAGFIDHRGRLGRYTLTDGRVVEAPIRRPHTFHLLELFKIDDGLIRQVEAVFITVPYHMPAAW